MSRQLKLALAQYPIERLPSFDAWRAKAAQWVREAAREGAGLLLFPEYGAMELTGLLSPELLADLAGQIAAMQDMLPGFIEAFSAEARRAGVFVVAPSFPVRLGDGRYVNRAHVFAPSGRMAVQDKQVMTRFEREQWRITGNGPLKMIDIGQARIGIAICYDVEFPLIARRMAEAGAEIILAPSCTDALAGYYRVQVGARARALENQCLVAVSPTIGSAPWSPAVDENVGAAGLFGPPDHGFPADGILALGQLNAAEWLYATADLDLVAEVRAGGQVFNYRHWPDQMRSNELEAVTLA